MQINNPYQYVPIGSISLIPGQDLFGYVQLFHKTPPKVHSMLSSPDTGSYIRGLGKSYDVPEENFPKIAQTIFFIAVGKQAMPEMSAALSTELGLSIDQAQKMASEIEKDIFGPIKAELSEFLSRKVASQPRDAAASTLRIAPLDQNKHQNVLDLKEIAAAKRQGLLTARPQPPLLTKQRSGEVSTSRSAAGGETPTPPKFPLPPKPPTSPLNFTGY